MPYSITTKDGITIQNIPDDVPPDHPSIKGRVAKIRAAGGAAALDVKDVKPQKFDPTDGMSSTDKFFAGVGKAFTDAGRGAGQLVGLVDRKDIDEARARDSALMNTGHGVSGNVTGNLLAYAPLAAIPGANTIAGGALVGAGAGTLQPVGTGDSRLQNIGEGALAGGAVPAMIRAGRVVKAGLIDPFTEAGRQRIVGGVLNRAAADSNRVVSNLQTAQGATPGFYPTVGQASNDAGVASLERAARAIDPAGFDAVDKSQRGALVDALRSVAGTPEARAAAVDSRESAAKALYGMAFDSDAMRYSVSKDAIDRAAFVGSGGIHQGVPLLSSQIRQDLATPGLRSLSERPMFKDAVQQAKTLAANHGVKIEDPLQSLQGLHYIKLALDDMATPNASNALGRNYNSAVNDMRAVLSREMEKVSPLYGNARSAFSEMSRPINQMDIGSELYNRFIPALADNSSIPFKSRADALAQAIRNGDKLAQNVTGLKGAKFSSIMSPEQIAAIDGVVKDSAMKAAAETAGRGVGSDTVQKMAMSNLVAESGLPSWIQSLGRVPGGWLRTAGDVLYTKNDETLRHLLADILKDPRAAARAMTAAQVGASPVVDRIRVGIQAPLLSLPAAVNASK